MGGRAVLPYLLPLLPYAAMVAHICFDVGVSALSKAAMSKGMSHFVFVVYSNALATLLFFPSSFIYLRLRGKRPPVTFSLLCKFFLLSVFGVTLLQNCLFTGLNYSSPTVSASINQLVPAFTFLLAVIFRMESLDLRSSRSQIKILGTLVSISGALIVILYKGPPLGVTTAHSSYKEPTAPIALETTDKWLIGAIFFVVSNLSASVFTIFQAVILKEYPSQMIMISFYLLFGTLQSAVVSLIAERNLNAWKLRPGIELTAIIYAAFCGMVSYSAVAWTIQKKGPLFVAIFQPLGIAIAAFLSCIFLGETLHVGSIVGAVVIVAGFYGVMWAQSREEKQIELNKAHQRQQVSSSSKETPLLGSHTDV